MMDRLVADPIPNIRFNVAKSYAVLIDILRRLPESGTIAELEASSATAAPSPKGEDLINEQILPNLEKLKDDEDVDVRYFATIAAGGSTVNAAERMETGP